MKGFAWIAPSEVRFFGHPDGWLAAEWGMRRGPVTAKRLFPVSDPEGAVMISDPQGEVWGVLRTVRELSPDSRQALERELRFSPYFPKIQNVSSLQRRNQQFEWCARTDFGPVRFFTDPLYESVHEHEDGRRIVADRSGQCYLLPADRHLDGKSVKKLRRWL